MYGGIVLHPQVSLNKSKYIDNLSWKSSISVTPGTQSTTDGQTNTNAMTAAGLSAHSASQTCRGIASSWYLPARAELNLLYTNRTAIGASDSRVACGIYIGAIRKKEFRARTRHRRRYSSIGTCYGLNCSSPTQAILGAPCPLSRYEMT